MLLAHSCACAIDHAVPGFGEPMDQAQAEDLTNVVWIKASPVLHTQSLTFVLN
jgi:hypothetical protein